jgi:hypothetical protein
LLGLCRTNRYRLSERLEKANDFETDFKIGATTFRIALTTITTLTELPISLRGRRLFLFPADRRRVPPGRRGRCRGSGLIGAAFSSFIMYTFSFEFSDAQKKTQKHDIFF